MYVACCILLLYSTSKSLLSETIMYCLCLMLTHDGTAGFLSFCFCFFTPPFVVLAASHVAVGYVVFLLCFARPSACHLRMRGIFGPRTVGARACKILVCVDFSSPCFAVTAVCFVCVVWCWLFGSLCASIFVLLALWWLVCALPFGGAGFCDKQRIDETRREKEEKGKEEKKRGFKM